MLSPVRMEFEYQVVRREDAGARRGGQDRARGGRSDGPAVPAARPGPRGLRMKALVTGAAGFIGSHLTDDAPRSRREVVGIDCFTDYYPRAIKEANLARTVGARIPFHRNERSSTPICRRSSTA